MIREGSSGNPNELLRLLREAIDKYRNAGNHVVQSEAGFEVWEAADDLVNYLDETKNFPRDWIPF